MAGQRHVAFDKLDRRAHPNRLLPAPHVHPAHDLSLAVQHALDAVLGLASEREVIEHPLKRRSVRCEFVIAFFRRLSDRHHLTNPCFCC